MPTTKDYIQARSLNQTAVDRGYTALAIAVVLQAVDDMRYFNHMRRLYPDCEEYVWEFEDAERFLCSDVCAEMFDLDFPEIVDIVKRETRYDYNPSAVFIDTNYRKLISTRAKANKKRAEANKKQRDKMDYIASKIDFNAIYELTGLTPRHVRKNDSRGI